MSLQFFLRARVIRWVAYSARMLVGFMLMHYHTIIAQLKYNAILTGFLVAIPLAITVMHMYQRWSTSRFGRKSILIISLFVNILILTTFLVSAAYEPMDSELNYGNISFVIFYYLVSSFTWLLIIPWLPRVAQKKSVGNKEDPRKSLGSIEPLEGLRTAS